MNKETLNIPQSVLDAASELIAIYGAHFYHLGHYEGKEVYLYKFPEDSSTGFPFVYLLGNNKVTEVSGGIALDIIDLLIKDDGE